MIFLVLTTVFGSPIAGVLSPATALVPVVVHEHPGGEASDDEQ
jgi:hypothetical protein